jgi:hypothetical protein
VINLPNVTLFTIDTTKEIDKTLRALYTSMNGINYGAVKLVTTKNQIEKHKAYLENDGITLEEPVIEVNNYNDYNYYVIGAPWAYGEDSYIDPFGNHHRVGNGGFSLRSKKLLDVPSRVEVPWEVNNSDFYWMPPGVINYHEDGNICVHNRHIYVEHGCKFAPVEVAVKFSQEARVPECEGITPFGFHYRLPPGVELS